MDKKFVKTYDKAYHDGRRVGFRDGIKVTLLATANCLCDKHGFEREQLSDLNQEVMKLCEEITEGFVTHADLEDVLLEEQGIKILDPV